MENTFETAFQAQEDLLAKRTHPGFWKTLRRMRFQRERASEQAETLRIQAAAHLEITKLLQETDTRELTDLCTGFSPEPLALLLNGSIDEIEVHDRRFNPEDPIFHPGYSDLILRTVEQFGLLQQIKMSGEAIPIRRYGTAEFDSALIYPQASLFHTGFTLNRDSVRPVIGIDEEDLQQVSQYGINHCHHEDPFGFRDILATLNANHVERLFFADTPYEGHREAKQDLLKASLEYDATMEGWEVKKWTWIDSVRTYVGMMEKV